MFIPTDFLIQLLNFPELSFVKCWHLREAYCKFISELDSVLKLHVLLKLSIILSF
jgi:hypothetical protein